MMRGLAKILAALAALAALALARWWWLAAPTGDPPPGVAARAEDVRPLPVGERVPPARVYGPDGKALDLLAVLTRKPTALIVFRGGW